MTDVDRDVVVLAGGVGAARFLEGVVQVVDPARVTAIVNTGDDTEFYGLTVSPDVDIVLFTLAGIVDPAQGWGVRDDTFNALDMLERLGRERWFLLGDRDLAVHIHRTELLRQGLHAVEVTDDLRRRLGLEVLVLPMSDQPVPARRSERRMAGCRSRSTSSSGASRTRCWRSATTARGGVASARRARRDRARLGDADQPEQPAGERRHDPRAAGVRDALRTTEATVVGVSPIVGGATIKGPADRMMRGLGMEVSAVGVARAYADFLDVLVIDQQDADLAARRRSRGRPCRRHRHDHARPGRQAGAGAGDAGAGRASMTDRARAPADLGGRSVQGPGREQAAAGRPARPSRARAPQPGDARRRAGRAARRRPHRASAAAHVPSHEGGPWPEDERLTVVDGARRPERRQRGRQRPERRPPAGPAARPGLPALTAC